MMMFFGACGADAAGPPVAAQPASASNAAASAAENVRRDAENEMVVSVR
jgi:hypothetical protein